MKFQIPSGALRVLQTLNAAGHQAYLVGGCVRDLLRGTAPHDWDICTSALPGEIIACFPRQRVLETGVKHGTVTVLDGEGAYEVTTYRVDGPYSDGRRPDSVRFVPSLTQDLARRDFTINAVAMDAEGNLQDPFGGISDIQAGLIRCVGQPDVRFQEDGLRVMRALRFAAVLEYTIDSATAAAIHGNKEILGHVAAERINGELRRLLTGPGAGRVLREYPDIFCAFWPELKPLITLEQHNPWHCWGGWEHTIHAVEAAPPELVLRLTMLLHDIGKPACKTTDEKGIDHFYGHPAVGAGMAKEMLRRLKFDNDTINQVRTLIRSHGTVLLPQPKLVRRLLNKLGPEGLFQLLEVARADNMGQAYEVVKDRLAVLAEVKALAEQIVAEGQCFARKDLAVSGNDVLEAGVPPGPQVGRTLNALLEKVINGELPNEREALLREIKRQGFPG